MNIVTKVLQSFGPRVLGGAASFLAGWIFVHTKGAIQVDPTQVVEIAGTMLSAYALTHRAASALGINPGDAASGTLVKAEKTALDTGMPVTPPIPPAVLTSRPPGE